MNNKILKLLTNTAGRLVFALISGAAYYIIALRFIMAHTSIGGGLLGFFFLPAIVCGMGLVITKILMSQEEQGNTGVMLAVFWSHLLLIIVSITFLIGMI
ncbi:MAG: hypothetical protein ACI4C7_00705 [Clostridia bacterium]